jgi:Tfp pilus assembly protein PilX
MKKVPHLNKILKNEEGIALVTVLVVMIVISIMGLSLMGLAMTNVKMSSNDRDFQSTYYIAESGATYMMNEVNRNIMDVYNSATTTNDLFTLFENRLKIGTEITYNSFDDSFGHKPYAKIKIVNLGNVNSTVKQYKIVSVGTINNHSRTVEKSFQITWVPKNTINLPTNTAVFVNTTVNLSRGAKITGGVGTNSSASNAISLSGGSSISGNIYVGPNAGSNVIYNPDNITISNPIKMPTTTTFALPPFPIFPSFPILPNAKAYSGSSSYDVILNGALRIDDWVSNNYTLNMNQDISFTDIIVESNYTLNINVGNVNRSMVVNNLNIINGKVNIIGNGKLTIYVKGNITMGSGSIINTGGDINNLNIYLKGSGVPSNPKNLSLSGSQKIFGSLFAEDANLSFTNGSGFQGNILTGGKSILIDGGVYLNTQLFFAPKADLTVSSGGTVSGVIITKTLTASGNGTINFNQLNIDQLPFFPSSGTGGGSATISNILSAGATREGQ